jgi:hypothetical protein
MISRGVLIFAHNSQHLDYSRLAIIAGKLATKNLKIPASLVADEHTIRWTKSNGNYSTIEKIFENIIITDQPDMRNSRNLKDGEISQRIPFVNSNRNLAWDLTPYQRTLVLDSDYIVLTSNLNKYLNTEDDFLIAESASDIYYENRLGYHDSYISDTGIKMRWATNFIFNKNENTKIFFDLCKVISENYQYYADLYRFDGRQYRNDIAFSIALHIINGFSTTDINFLPSINTVLDSDLLVDIVDKKLIFLIKDRVGTTYTACSIFDRDIHFMNKQNLLRLEDKLLEL